MSERRCRSAKPAQGPVGLQIDASFRVHKQGRPTTAPKVDFPAIVDTKEADAATFLKYLNFQMQFHCFPAVEQPLLYKLARIGIGPGRPFDLAAYFAEVAKAIEEASMPAATKFTPGAENHPRSTAGTFPRAMPASSGRTSSRAPQRHWKYIYVNSAVEEAIYPTANVDGAGKQLDSAQEAVCSNCKGRAAAGQLPESLRANANTRYPLRTQSIAIPSVTALRNCQGWDSLLDACVHLDQPAGKDAANWLPAPKAAVRHPARIRAEARNAQWLVQTCRRSPGLAERSDRASVPKSAGVSSIGMPCGVRSAA